MANQHAPHRLVIQACLVATLSYLAARLGGALIVRPQMVSPLWLGNVLLASVLLLVQRRIWPVVLAAGLAGFLLYDLQASGPIRSIVWLILSNAVEVLTAALCLSNSFDGVPRLNNVKALAKYSFYAVFLAPFVGAFLGALSTSSNYWASWQVAFFSEALGFLTLAPAILGWVSNGPALAKKSRAFYLEATSLIAPLVLLGYFAFVVSGKGIPPALLYSVVPFLLWSALRFGSIGVSTSMVVLAFLSIWGVVHGRGPFTEPEPISRVLSLQLFLLSTATPFMILAALVEERKQAEEELRESRERLSLAVQAGRMYAFEWDEATDVIVRSGQCVDILNWLDDPTRDTGRQFVARVHPEDREAYATPETGLSPENPTYQTSYRVLRPDGSAIWLEANGHAFFDGQGRRLRIKGMVADVTARKRAEETLRRRDAELAEAQRLARVASWQWDPETDTVTWSEELYRITGLDPNLPAVSYKEHPKLYTAESWERLKHAVEEALRTGKPYELDVEMVRPDGTTLWLIARGEAQRDTTGRIVQLRGTVQDITERKGAEEVLVSMSGRLITAHEEERTRIARELHDDLSQRMALLQIGLEKFEQDTAGLLSKDRQKLHSIAEVASEVSSNIHNLSHQLHPSKLDTLGLVASLRGFCKEFSGQHSLQVQFVNDDIPGQIPKDVTLCLFRIVQEALRNVVKHSGAAEAKVELSSHGDRIDLCISDPGVGFKSESAKGEAGLGLISMRERLRLVGGHVVIESEPSHGTRIRACVPLTATGAQHASEATAHRAGA